MKTNRLTKHSARWFAFLVARELATRQDIVAARRRLAEDLTRRIREERRREAGEGGDAATMG